MTCKNCGADVGIEYRLCPYCRSELEYPEREKTVIINHYYTQNPPPSYRQEPVPIPYQQPRSNADKYGASALVFAILGLVLGVFLLKIIFSVLSLSYVKKAKADAADHRMNIPGTATAATIICVISLAFAALLLIVAGVSVCSAR